MKKKSKNISLVAIHILTVSMLLGCKNYFNQPRKQMGAKIGETSQVHSELKNLPKPKEQIAAAVYKFRDQTGQYKLAEAGASWSTAISQGTTAMLLKSLEESNWFLSVERENVSNLMNERKIIRSSVAQYQNNTDPLPPMLFAGVILEGGIISYDANIITGGTGLRYFGTGGSAQYRQDRVSVYLRAVATKSGKIIKTVYTSKTVLSQSIDVGVFRYVKLSKLLEAETGITTNEPAQMALQEAIDKSVVALVLEGLKDGLWEAAESEKDSTLKVALNKYEKDKQNDYQADVYNFTKNYKKKGLSFNIGVGQTELKTDYKNPRNRINYNVGLNYLIQPNNEIGLQVGKNSFLINEIPKANYGFRIHNNYFLQPGQRFNSYLTTGVEGIYFQNNYISEFKNNTTQRNFHINLFGGAGLEFSLTKLLGLRGQFTYNWFLNDKLDGQISGKLNDNYLNSQLGLIIYFNKNKK